MDTINITNAKPGEILRWNGKIAVWQNVSSIESERLRKERKEKLERINASQSKLQ